jgi:hypothetical protein
MRIPLFIALTALLLVAADDPKPSGLKPGTDIPGPFTPYNVTGKHKGRFHCFLCEHGLDPAVLVFVRGSDGGKEVEELLQTLDGVSKDNARARLAVYGVFLDDEFDLVADDDKREVASKKVEDQGTKLERAILALESRKNLAKYRLDDNAEVIVVLYDRYKIKDVKNFPKGKPDSAAIKALKSEVLEKLIKKK